MLSDFVVDLNFIVKCKHIYNTYVSNIQSKKYM